MAADGDSGQILPGNLAANKAQDSGHAVGDPESAVNKTADYADFADERPAFMLRDG